MCVCHFERCHYSFTVRFAIITGQHELVEDDHGHYRAPSAFEAQANALCGKANPGEVLMYPTPHKRTWAYWYRKVGNQDSGGPFFKKKSFSLSFKRSAITSIATACVDIATVK